MTNEKIQKGKPSSAQVARLAILFIMFLYLVWIGAWALEQTLGSHVASLATDQGQFVYWLLMKVLFWVLPAIVVIRFSGRTLVEVLKVKKIRAVLLWGGGVGLLLGVIAVLSKTLGHQPLFSTGNIWSWIGGVLVAPIVEEIVFRGAILGALTQRYRFAIANLLTAFFFLGIHLPGWYFQGVLIHNLLSPLNGALAIFILGVVFGYVASRSDSVSGSILTHILNNFFNA